MRLHASTGFSLEPDSEEAGRLVGQSIREAFGGQSAQTAIVYATMNHDQPALLASIRRELGPGVALLGCSVQGLACGEEVTEDGLAVGVMAFGGEALRCATAAEHEIGAGSLEKGRMLAHKLKTDLGQEPNLTVLMYDPLCGADVEALLVGLRREIASPVIGGGAGQPWGSSVRTYQYADDRVFSKGAVALGICGAFDFEMGLCHGTVPTGATVTVTKAAGSRILEIDGRRASDVWCEHTGLDPEKNERASWVIAVERRYETLGPNGPTERIAHMIRGAFGVDLARGAIILQAGIPEGSKVMFHHRAVEQVLAGTKAMGVELAERLQGKTPWAVLGFECGARTFPFLGPSNTREQHLALRRAVAPSAPWLGMMAWGEIAPLGGEPAFHNFTYPVAVLTH